MKAKNADGIDTGWIDLGQVNLHHSIGMIKRDFKPGSRVSLINKIVTAVFKDQKMVFAQDWPALGGWEGVIGIGIELSLIPSVLKEGDIVNVSVIIGYKNPPYQQEIIADGWEIYVVRMVFPIQSFMKPAVRI